MTLASTNYRNDYVSNGVSTTFNFTFLAFLVTDISVYITDLNGNQYTLTNTQDYTVSGVPGNNGGSASGSITIVNNSQIWINNVGSPISGYTLSIVRTPMLEQNLSLRNEGSFYPEDIENEMDDLVMLIQLLSGPSVVLPQGLNPANFSPILPTTLSSGAGLAIIVNSMGTGFALGTSPVSLQIPVPVSKGGTGSGASLAGGDVMISSGQTIIEGPSLAMIEQSGLLG